MAILLGKNVHFGSEHAQHRNIEDIILTDDARKQGTYIIGTTGTGKTTLLVNMIMQDIYNGDGLCVLDPHGDFTTDIMARVPNKRLKDVMLLDPSDYEFPFGLNLFECDKTNPLERDLVVSTLIDTLYKLFKDSWGPRMEDLLRHGILSLLLHDQPTTLVHLMMIMVSQPHRKLLTKRAREQDPILRMYWEDEFPENNSDGSRPRTQIELTSSSLNKIGRFITNPVMRHIVGQPKSTVNLKDAMDEGKIILINLSKGHIGQDNSSLLGAVFINQLLIAALSRSTTPENQRRPFHLYVDEYQNFATKTFPQLQSEARKYGIDTVVAHQYRDQLDEENQGSSLNVANVINLRVSGKDADELSRQLELTPPFIQPKHEPIMVEIGNDVFVQRETSQGKLFTRLYEADRTYSDIHLEVSNLLSQIPNYQAVCRVLSPKKNPEKLYQFRIELKDKPPVIKEAGEGRIQFIRDQSRNKVEFTRKGIIDYINDYTSSSEAPIPLYESQ